jgi:hypothetical protein
MYCHFVTIMNACTLTSSDIQTLTAHRHIIFISRHIEDRATHQRRSNHWTNASSLEWGLEPHYPKWKGFQPSGTDMKPFPSHRQHCGLEPSCNGSLFSGNMGRQRFSGKWETGLVKIRCVGCICMASSENIPGIYPNLIDSIIPNKVISHHRRRETFPLFVRWHQTGFDVVSKRQGCLSYIAQLFLELRIDVSSHPRSSIGHTLF